MERNFGKIMFALFAAMLGIGSVFATTVNGSAAIFANSPPVISGMGGPSSLNVGEAGTWSITANDPDGNYLSYSVSWGDGLGVSETGGSRQSGSTGTFQHTYSSAGTYTITFTVTDSVGAQTQSSITATVTGTSTNHPPVFSAVSCPVTGQSATCYVYATDPDSDPVTYTLDFGDGTAKVSGMQNAFVHTYTNAGTYTITIEAKDKYGAGTGTALQVTLTGTQNQKPIITGGNGPVSLLVGETGTWTVNAYDPDGNYLSYSVRWGDEGTGPSGSDNLGRTGSTATFQHTYSKAGTYTITFTVKDDKGATAQSLSSVVVGANSSGGPQIVRVWQQDESFEPVHMLYAEIKDGGEVAKYTNVKVTLQITYPGGSTESYDIAYHTPGTAYSYNDYFGFGFSKGSQCGTYKYAITAERRAGNSPAAYKEGTFTLGSSCSASDSAALAKLGKISYWYGKVNQHADINGAWQTDPDGTSGANLDKITYCKKFYPGTTDIRETSVETFSGWRNAGNSGDFTSVKPVYHCVGSKTVSTNQPPVITSTAGPSSLAAGETGTWTVSAYDPDGNYLSYSVRWGDEGTGPSGSDNLGRTGSTATFQHTYSKAGTYTITFTVKDDKGAQTQSTLTVRVAGSTPSPSGPLDLQVELLSSDCYKYNGNAVVCGPAIDMTTYNGNMFVVSDAGYQASRLLAVLDPGTADYLFLYKVPGRDYFSVAQHFYMTDKDQFNVEKLSADTYKYENGGIVTGVSLEFTAQSGYAIVAYTPSGVRYETSRLLAVIDSQGGEFRHLFKQAGNDYFTTAKRFYTSQASNEPESVTAAISAIPTELYQYDSVYVAGKVGRSADQNSGAQKYLVVLAFDDGAAIPKAYSGAISSQGTQVRVEEITLAPGESREVSAYFTANKLGTNFAAIAVYAAGSGGYGLVASDTAKVYVKESGIPSPPNESVTIVLEKGWNQISVPAFSLQVEELADACDISKNVWAYNAATKQYEKAATLGGGHVGFWVRAYSDCKYTIKEPYLTPAPYAFNLKAGWNMIGAPLLATSISSFAGNCKITSGPWNYSPAAGQYGYSVELAPGKGYWVKVAYDCTLGGSDMPPAEPQETAVAKAVVNVAVASSTGSAAASVEPEAVAVNNASN